MAYNYVATAVATKQQDRTILLQKWVWHTLHPAFKANVLNQCCLVLPIAIYHKQQIFRGTKLSRFSRIFHKRESFLY